MRGKRKYYKKKQKKKYSNKKIPRTLVTYIEIW
ncbi:hypothetical protein T4B_5412 [Trichinella pseudospiralis]|uniref:Uncharacterized protein n=1 Tax=Trichinella pseudospiralis TaxID=6337 RepID=A0A0V1DK80_TRIPS|nr:hypothetical protein T4A_10738 [Trichinella pseudospiralis]KRY93934.1 hypothetical protein T4B_5412 [Trichinella pseudospiralis]